MEDEKALLGSEEEEKRGRRYLSLQRVAVEQGIAPESGMLGFGQSAESGP